MLYLDFSRSCWGSESVVVCLFFVPGVTVDTDNWCGMYWMVGMWVGGACMRACAFCLSVVIWQLVECTSLCYACICHWFFSTASEAGIPAGGHPLIQAAYSKQINVWRLSSLLGSQWSAVLLLPQDPSSTLSDWHLGWSFINEISRALI